jgi:hypothetical protein
VLDWLKDLYERFRLAETPPMIALKLLLAIVVVGAMILSVLVLLVGFMYLVLWAWNIHSSVGVIFVGSILYAVLLAAAYYEQYATKKRGW